MPEIKELQNIIEQSDSNESTENVIKSQLDIADDIMKSVQNIPELRDKFQKEYDELILNILNSVESENKITNEEFNKIKSEFFDIQNLNISSIWTNIQIEEKQLKWFENKKINEYTKNEAFIALKYLQNNYTTKYSEDNILPKSIENDSINNLSNKDKVLFFQKKLINIITWTNTLTKNWFKNDYILWINETNWFYIFTIDEFKNKLKSIDNIDSLNYLEIKNYLTYINKIEYYWIWDIENTDVNILEKYIPKYLINNFIKKYKNNDFYQASTNEIDAKYNDILLQYISWWWDIIFIDKLISIWKTKDEIIMIISEKKSTPKNNLIKELTKYKEEHKEYYEEKEKIELNEVSNKPNQTDFKSQEFNANIWKNHDDYEYNTESWIITKIEWKEVNLKLNPFEKTIVEDNVLMLNNIINFYNFFKKLNMVSVWEYRTDLLDSFWDKAITIDWNFIEDEELRKIWNHLIDFINNNLLEGKEKLNKSNTLDWATNELRKFSRANSLISDEKTVNIYWEDPFKWWLRNLWIIWSAYYKFKKEKFRKNMKWKNINKK